MHLVDEAGQQGLTDRRCATANPNIFPVRCFLRLLQRRFDPVRNKIKCRATLHLDWCTRVVCQHEHWRVIRRRVAPPPSPRIVGPRTTHWTKHVASQNPCADILERFRGKIIVDARRPDTLTLHLLKYVSLKEPREDLRSTHSQRILQVLSRPGPEPIHRNGKCCHSNFTHDTPFDLQLDARPTPEILTSQRLPLRSSTVK